MTDIEYIMNRLKIMEYRMWADHFKPSSCGYCKPKSCDGLFKPTDRNSKNWNGPHRYMQPQPPIRTIRQ